MALGGGGGDDDLLPRTDISGPASASSVISGMGSANWKERKAAMDEVRAFLGLGGLGSKHSIWVWGIWIWGQTTVSHRVIPQDMGLGDMGLGVKSQSA